MRSMLPTTHCYVLPQCQKAADPFLADHSCAGGSNGRSRQHAESSCQSNWAWGGSIQTLEKPRSARAIPNSACSRAAINCSLDKCVASRENSQFCRGIIIATFPEWHTNMDTPQFPFHSFAHSCTFGHMLWLWHEPIKIWACPQLHGLFPSGCCLAHS